MLVKAPEGIQYSDTRNRQSLPSEREVSIKEGLLKSAGISDAGIGEKVTDEANGTFWRSDEGLDEIRRITKET